MADNVLSKFSNLNSPLRTKRSWLLSGFSVFSLASIFVAASSISPAESRGGNGAGTAQPQVNGKAPETSSAASGGGGRGNSGGGSGKISTLAGVKPLRADTSAYIKDPAAAAILGKALFWDIQSGSDGQACASCHFHAGADIRGKNQIQPGANGTFSARLSDPANPTGPNVELSAADFPFRKYANPADRRSAILYDTDDRFGSSGTFSGDYNLAGNKPGPVEEQCPQNYDPANPFHKNGYVSRRFTGRNTPSNVNAIFNYRQFWDGRANAEFNGVNPFGPRDTMAKIWVERGNGKELIPILIANASVASQATGPVLSSGEMSCENRAFSDVGHKLLPLKALAQQKVHSADSLFSKSAGLINNVGNGLNKNYADLVRQAFFDTYTKGGQAQLEANFSLFWGLAIMEYEALLISDQAPFDRGVQTKLEKDGQGIFEGKGGCADCHAGPLLTKAAVTAAEGPNPVVLEQVELADGTKALTDRGFRNIGVRPTREDRGLGGEDPIEGGDLSFARQFILKQAGRAVADHFNTTGATLTGRDGVDGAFKIPGLRNVALTAPYFHNGGEATLDQVIELYNRGGNRQEFPNGSDSSGTADLPVLSISGRPDKSNVDTKIKSSGLSLSAQDKAALVAFLKSLTDNRVACHAGPFDHPQLPLSLGLIEDLNGGTPGNGSGQRATDKMGTLPATGVNGLTAERNSKGNLPCFPNSGNMFDTFQVFNQILVP